MNANQSDANKMNVCMCFILKARCIGICLLLHCFAISLRKRINISLQPIEYYQYCMRYSRVAKQTIKTKIKIKFKLISKRRTQIYSFHNFITKNSIPFFILTHSHSRHDKKNDSPNPEDMDRHSSGSSTSIQGKSIKSIKLITPINFQSDDDEFSLSLSSPFSFQNFRNICLFLLFSRLLHLLFFEIRIKLN